MQYLYNDGEFWHFMVPDTFEQFAAGPKRVADAQQWLKEQDSCIVTLWNGVPLYVAAPNFVELKIVETDPGVRGDTAQGGTKPAKLETGAVVRVPLFVEEGEVDSQSTRAPARTCPASSSNSLPGLRRPALVREAQCRREPIEPRARATNAIQADATPAQGGNPRSSALKKRSRRAAARADGPRGALVDLSVEPSALLRRVAELGEAVGELDAARRTPRSARRPAASAGLSLGERRLACRIVVDEGERARREARSDHCC